MYKYKNDEYFLKLVKSGNENQVKGEISNLLLKYKGDRKESDAAIEYAASQSVFQWDIHDGKEVPSHINLLKDKFNYEKGALRRNFSKERYERVLKLLKEYLREREIQKTPHTESKNTKATKSSGGRGPEMTGREIRPEIYKTEKNRILPFILIAIAVLGIVLILINR